MAHRSIEEVIQTIAPSRERGIPNAPTIGVGISSDNGQLATSLSQAGQQIAQLESAYQQQANLITENTQALQSNTSSKSSSGGSTLGSVTSSIFGGAFGFLSPIISGIASLFGGGSSTPQQLPIYTPPPPVSISGVLQSTPVPSAASGSNNSASAPNTSASTANTSGTAASSGGNQTNYSPQITVNVSAMDSQSFINNVVAEL
jgi:hypothetical protein